MNWIGSGFITIIDYQINIGGTLADKIQLLTENNLDILTENSLEILTENSP